MHPTLLIITGILIGCWNSLIAQQPGEKIITSPSTAHSNHTNSRILSEICGNNIDDDGNGLQDCEDYSCYYSNSIVCNCMPVDVIWLGDDNGDLFWINHQTGVETFIGNMGRPMTDITWAPDGNLYGVDWFENKIWRIDPVTAQIAFVSAIPGYDFSNALTSDGNGNLYIASRLAVSANIIHIIRLDLTNNSITQIADLTPTSLTSAGDLAFYNGSLLLTCDGNILATINTVTGSITSKYILGLPGGAYIYGIVVKANGKIYLSDINKLYNLDMSTMQASLYYSCSTPNLFIWGMASFNDYCFAPLAAPICNARVSIDIQSSQPYCSDPGVLLKANGMGIIGNGVYKWTLPDGSNLTIQNLTATKEGKYKVQYYSENSVGCWWEDSVVLQINQAPDTRLGSDTILCTGTKITFSPVNTSNVVSYLWQDGSSNTRLTINQPGLYWLQTWNACGSFRDSVIVSEKYPAKADLGPSREICQYDTLQLKNYSDGPGYAYTWSDRSTDKTMIISAPGKYWIDVTNTCGLVSDTIVITKKVDGCECSLFMPTGFTPNGDGKNETIKPFSNCLYTGELKIFNRWGQLIYQTKDLQRGWNGIYNNLAQASGVYIYQVSYKYTFRPGEFAKKGTFVLIR